LNPTESFRAFAAIVDREQHVPQNKCRDRAHNVNG